MGYCIEQVDSKVFISSEDQPKALLKLKHQLFPPITNTRPGDRWSYSGSRYAWVHDNECTSARNLVEFLDAWRWHVSMDDDGNITNLWFEGEKHGDDSKLFEALAPFVADGSYIEMIGEDGVMWRETFSEGKYTRVHPEIIW